MNRRSHQYQGSDLRWLGESNLVAASVTGRSTRVDLPEHLAHDGRTAAIAVRLNSRGRKAISACRNRLLRRLTPGHAGNAGRRWI